MNSHTCTLFKRKIFPILIWLLCNIQICTTPQNKKIMIVEVGIMPGILMKKQQTHLKSIFKFSGVTGIYKIHRLP